MNNIEGFKLFLKKKHRTMYELRRIGRDFYTLYGDFDTIHAYFVDCLSGPIKECVFTDKFDELNEICRAHAVFTTYIGLAFYKNGKKIGSGKYSANWNEIVALANSQTHK